MALAECLTFFEHHRLVIKLAFDQNTHSEHELKQCREWIEGLESVFFADIDLSNVNYLYSADLGTLLIIRNSIYKKFGVTPTLINISQTTLNILKISSFNKIFNVKI